MGAFFSMHRISLSWALASVVEQHFNLYPNYSIFPSDSASVQVGLVVSVGCYFGNEYYVFIGQILRWL